MQTPFLAIVLICVLSVASGAILDLLTNIGRNSEGYVAFDGRYREQIDLNVSRIIAKAMAARNFSIWIDLKLPTSARGTLFAIYAGSNRGLELYVEGHKSELRAHWRRYSTSAAAILLQATDIEDGHWHQVAFEVTGPRVRLYYDCAASVDGDFPEIDFEHMNRSGAKPNVWVGQRQAVEHTRLAGYLKTVNFSTHAGMLTDNCGWSTPAPPVTTDAVPATTPAPRETQISDGTVKELRERIAELERVVANLTKNDPPAKANASAQTDRIRYEIMDLLEPGKNTTDGECPNCYEYLRHRTEHVEQEMRKWRDTIGKLTRNVHNVLLIQRGCKVNNSYLVPEGSQWTNDNSCTECICTVGDVYCKPKGCTPLPGNCTTPYKPAGSCCPVCGRSCRYEGLLHVHGSVFWPKPCVKCGCMNGETACAHQRTPCPPLNCSLEEQFKHDNHCCAVCANDDFCSQKPCHPDAVCTNRKFDRVCKCKLGFFGDGEQCYDMDECEWDSSAAEQLGGCGFGSRCINSPGSFRCECLPGYAKLSLDSNVCFDMIIR